MTPTNQPTDRRTSDLKTQASFVFLPGKFCGNSAKLSRKNFVNLGPIYADPAMSSGVCLFAGEGIIIHKINRGLAVSLFLLLADVLHKVDLGPGALVASGQHDLHDLVALLGSPRREQAQRVV